MKYIVRKTVGIDLQHFAEKTTQGESVEGNDTSTDTSKEYSNPFDRLYDKDFSQDSQKDIEDKVDETKEPTKEPLEDEDVDSQDKKVDETKATGEVDEAKEEEKEIEYDEIIYNKEKVKIPITERQTYLQKGYNYDKVKATMDRTREDLLRAAKVEGFNTIEEYLKDIENREKLLFAERLESAEGDPNEIDEIIKNHPEVIKTREERKLLEYQRIKDELKQDVFFGELENQFDELMKLNPTADPSLVYKVIRSDYLTPDKLDEIISRERETVKKKVLADVHDKERRTIPKGGDIDNDKEVVQPSELSKQLANIFGVSASKIAQRTHDKLKRS